MTDAPADDLSWSPPAAPGAAAVTYDLLRGASPETSGASCLVSGIAATTATDGTVPPAGVIYYYVVRVENACGGTLGTAASGAGRSGPACA